MNSREAVLIFDIGKTTKKAILFDTDFHVIEETTETFPELSDDDGFASDDLSRVSAWVIDIMYRYTDRKDLKITHCNFSAYGASLVNLDSAGDRVTPFYNYLKPFPDDLKDNFCKNYGGEVQVSSDTASPFFGMLNSGLQLLWLKHVKPTVFARIVQSLHLPQYFTYLISGQYVSDITSIGCHTMLWHVAKGKYHEWVHNESILKLLPPVWRTDQSIQIQFNKQSIKLGVGVHDSSGALMPYLATQHQPFLLLSTGTWNICFNPKNEEPLTPGELAHDCLCYMKYDGTPVKASRIFLGREHEVQAAALSKHFGVSADYYANIAFDYSVYQKLKSDSGNAFYPMAMEGTGPLPGKQVQYTRLDNFQTYEEAYHQLMRYLVAWQLLSISLVDPDVATDTIIVVGGFTKNRMFLEMLKLECPSRKIMVSDHPRASALGAAWLVCGAEAYEKKAHLLKIMDA